MPRSAVRWLLVLSVLACAFSQAVEAAQEDVNAQEIGRLTKLLESPDPTVRLAAAAALGDMADTARISRNLDRADSPLPALRETAAPALIKLIGDPDTAVRRMAVLAIGKVR